MNDLPAFLDRRPLVWSYSMLHCFRDICAHQGEARYIAKTIKFVETPEIVWGNQVHSAFEYRIGGQKPLPVEMQQWEGFAVPFDGKSAVVEQQLGITAEGQSCKFFSDKPQVYGRGKIDVYVIQGETAGIWDFKTGKSAYEDPFELEVGALLLHAKHPHLRKIVGQYVWLKENRLSQMYDLSDTAKTWNEVNRVVQAIQGYKQSGDYPKKRSGLCGWCQRFDCENNTNRGNSA